MKQVASRLMVAIMVACLSLAGHAATKTITVGKLKYSVNTSTEYIHPPSGWACIKIHGPQLMISRRQSGDGSI